MKLRLLITQTCSRTCLGCCNKQFDLESLPIADHYNYDEIYITGGEPLSNECEDKTYALLQYLKHVDVNESRKVYIYTTIPHKSYMLHHCDGLTLTLHEQDDVLPFLWNKPRLEEHDNKSLRLNIFKGVTIPESINLSKWQVKSDIEWIENCPLPENEVFMKTKTI